MAKIDPAIVAQLEDDRKRPVDRLIEVRQKFREDKKAGKDPDYSVVTEATNESHWAWVRLETYRTTGWLIPSDKY